MDVARFQEPEFRERLRVHLASFAEADDRRAAWEVASTAAVYVALLFLTAFALRRLDTTQGVLLAVVSVALLALTQVRAFLVHHDLCHRSLFRSAKVNALVAPFVGTFASTSSHVWKREHDRHHRDSNNLDRSQDGQTGAWTVEQYRAAKGWQRALYRVVNAPPVLFGLVPPLYFLGFMRVAARWYENVLFALFVAALWWSGTLGAFFVALLPATWFGFLLFHAQHTGPSLVRRHTAEWDHVENGLVGSTCLVTPRVPLFSPVLDWFLYGVEFHHVHHLLPQLPAWRQRACHEAGADLFTDVPRITLGGAVRATKLALYDEAQAKLVPFPSRT
ncbi:MAG: fatty acid desaturase [Myxococcaceae bacterium]